MQTPNCVMNLSKGSWLRIRASWMHRHAWVYTFPCHRPLPLCMHVHVAYWPMAVAWECAYPSICVHPGCTNPQPRCCTQIHDTVWHSSQRKWNTLTTLDDLCTVCNTCQLIPLRVIEIGDTG